MCPIVGLYVEGNLSGILCCEIRASCPPGGVNYLLATCHIKTYINLYLLEYLFCRTPRSRSVTIGGATEIDSAAEEIERKSALIQREMERERRARSVSPSPVVTSHNALTSLSSSLPPRLSTSRAITSSKIQVRNKPFLFFTP